MILFSPHFFSFSQQSFMVSCNWFDSILQGRFNAHDDVIKWKHFSRALCAGNSPVNGHWRGTLMFSLICAWTNGWANHRDAGDLRRPLGRHCNDFRIRMITLVPVDLCFTYFVFVAKYWMFYHKWPVFMCNFHCNIFYWSLYISKGHSRHMDLFHLVLRYLYCAYHNGPWIWKSNT